MRAVRQHGPALEVRAEPLPGLGERYRRYRLGDAHLQLARNDGLLLRPALEQLLEQAGRVHDETRTLLQDLGESHDRVGA